MNKEKLVSIIIPVYNVETYLTKCLDSVCNQTYQNLEIIIIDDESPDHCGQIADIYASKDYRIRVEHIKNRGAGGARNVALEMCTGDFIMFVDSDDWLEISAVEVMINALEETNSDIVLCQYWDEYVNKSVEHSFLKKEGECSAQEFAEGMIHSWEYIINSNKIYRKSVIKDLRFPERRCIDDEFFTYKAVINAKNTVLIKDFLYHYRIRKSSAMGNPANQKQRLQDQIAFVNERFIPLCNAFPKLRTQFLQHKIEVLLSVMRNSVEFPDIYKEARREVRKNFRSILFNRDIDTNIKKSCILYLLKKSCIQHKI